MFVGLQQDLAGRAGGGITIPVGDLQPLRRITETAAPEPFVQVLGEERLERGVYVGCRVLRPSMSEGPGDADLGLAADGFQSARSLDPSLFGDAETGIIRLRIHIALDHGADLELTAHPT